MGENTLKMLEVERRSNAPIAFRDTAYINQREMPYWKIIAAHETFLQGMLVPAEQG
jgi:maleamate amidohydrolase